MISLSELTHEWLNYARNDLRSAQFMTDMHPIPCEIICFHCQQTVEKALKAFLIFHGQEPPRTHDLELLWKMCNGLEANFATYKSDCKRLTQYAVVARYPNELQIDVADAKIAIKSAAALLEFVEGLVK